MDERVELRSRNTDVEHFYNISYSVWEDFTFGQHKYRLKVGRTPKTDLLQKEYLHENAVMLDGNQYYLSALEVELWDETTSKWRNVCVYVGARTSMRFNPRRISGIVGWDDDGRIDDEVKMVGMMVILVASEQA